MNKIFYKAATFLSSLDSRRFAQLYAATIGSIIVLAFLIIVGQLRTVTKMNREVVAIGKARDSMRLLLDRADAIQEQKRRVEEILAKDKNFLLPQYVQELVGRLSLQSNLKGTPAVTTSELENLGAEGYEEVRVEVEFINLDTQRLVQLLTELEQNERIDLKTLTITRSSKGASIDVQMTISTIELKAQAPEQT